METRPDGEMRQISLVFTHQEVWILTAGQRGGIGNGGAVGVPVGSLLISDPKTESELG